MDAESLRRLVEATDFASNGHNLLGYIGSGDCQCDPDVGAAPCMRCAARQIKEKCDAALKEFTDGR